MCLDTLDKETVQYKSGWKVFIKNKKTGKLESPLYHLNFVEGAWQKDKNNRTLRNTYMTFEYPAGFHFWVNKNHAVKNMFTLKNYQDMCLKFFEEESGELVIRKIKAKNIVASGSQNPTFHSNLKTRKVGVCKEIFVEKELSKNE